MMDLFRQHGGEVTWVHEKCVRGAMETWLTKKRQQKLEAEKKAKESVQ